MDVAVQLAIYCSRYKIDNRLLRFHLQLAEVAITPQTLTNVANSRSEPMAAGVTGSDEKTVSHVFVNGNAEKSRARHPQGFSVRCPRLQNPKRNVGRENATW